MSSTKLKIIHSQLSVEYQQMKSWAARDGERAKKLAAARSAATEAEDSVTLSSVRKGENGTRDARATLSQPVTSEERQALMQAFSIRV